MIHLTQQNKLDFENTGQNYGITLFTQFIVKTTLKCPTIFPSDNCAKIIDTQYMILKLFVLLFRPTSYFKLIAPNF